MAVPPDGKRSDLVPDYGDAGASPEIVVEQYPLYMGRRRDDDDSGIRGSVDVSFEAVLRQMENALKISCSSPGDTVSNVVATGAGASRTTNAASRNIMRARLSATRPAYPWRRQPPISVNYKASPQSAASNPWLVDMIVSMIEQMRGHPCRPPEYKHRRLSRSARWPRVPPVTNSPRRPPPRNVESDWKVPPTDSISKNPIHVNKRFEADGQRRRRYVIARLAEHRLLVATARETCKKSEVTRDTSERTAVDMASAAHKRRGRNNMSSDSDTLGDAGEQINKVTMTDRFKSDEAPSRAPASKRERPVDFDDAPELQNEDPFDINQFLTQFASLGMDDDLGERLRSMLNIS